MKDTIICCGNIAFDIISTDTHNIFDLPFSARPGGSVFNTAIQLSRLGLDVSMISKTGQDFLGDILLKVMGKENINTKYTFRDKNIKTGLAMAEIDAKGNSSYLFYKAQGEHISIPANKIPQNVFKKAAVFHTASAFSYNDVTFENVISLMCKSKKENVFITYDPNWRAGRIKNEQKARRRIKKIVEYVDLLKLSDTDATGITGEKTLSSALKKLPDNIVVTLGEKGSFFKENKKKITSPAFKIKVEDTIGAGDAFTAGLIYLYCRKGKEKFFEEKKEALTFASAVSALVCKGKGATSGLKNINQVKRFLSNN